MTLKKINTTPSITLLVFRAAMLCFFIMLFLPLNSLADYKIEMGLPNLPSGSAVQNPAQYVQYFFIFGLALIGFLAVAALAVGGIMWMTGGSITSTEKARNIIVGAVSGVVLLLCSYLLLYTIDPSLTNLTPHINPLGNMPAATPVPAWNANLCSPPCSSTQECLPPRGCVAKPSGTAQECSVHAPSTCTMAKCAAGGQCYMGTWDTAICDCVYPVQ